MRSSASLHRGEQLWMPNVGDIENANAARPFLADRVRYSLHSAIDSRIRRLRRNEKKIAIDGHIALRSRTNVFTAQSRLCGISNIPHLIAAPISLKDVWTGHRDI